MGLESNKHPNSNASFYFGFIILLFFVGGLAAAFFTTYWPPLGLVIISGVGSVAIAIVNFKNTFETNDDWKTIAGVIIVLLTILLFVLPISRHAV